MQVPQKYVGVDPASDTFTTALFIPSTKSLPIPVTYPNGPEGFDMLLQWFKGQRIDPSNSVICIEHTGVYIEHLCYHLFAKGFKVVLEAPQKVKKAFRSQSKTDPMDSRQIAEYAFRYFDKLSLWVPSEEILEQLQVLLATREQFVQQKTANMNSLKTATLKRVKTPVAETCFQSAITHLNLQIKTIEETIDKLIKNHPTIGPMATIVMTVPGVGLLLTANLLVLTHGFTKFVNAKQIASHAGICPHEFISGKTVYKKPRSRKFGPPRLRKLLHLAAMSVKTHNTYFRQYFQNKLSEGKAKNLILNNIANKLLKIIFSLVRSGKSYDPSYQSMNPIFSMQGT